MRFSWLFRCYLDDHGEDVIDAWYQAQSEPVQIKFDVRMKFLRQTPREGWVRPGFDTYAGGVGYARFEVGNVQHRIFGAPYELGPLEYIWLIAATKKGQKFDPRNADQTAIERKDLSKRDRSRSRDCQTEQGLFG
jgi:hypothetical protein